MPTQLNPTPDQVYAEIADSRVGLTAPLLALALIATLTGTHPGRENYVSAAETASKYGLPVSRVRKILDGLERDGRIVRFMTSTGYGGKATAIAYRTAEWQAHLDAQDAAKADEARAAVLRRKAEAIVLARHAAEIDAVVAELAMLADLDASTAAAKAAADTLEGVIP